MLKRKVVRHIMQWTSEWNEEIHQEVENRVMAEFKKLFPEGSKNRETIIQDMRSFYYSRMSTTANILLASVAVIVSFVSLLAALIALFK